jgi:hypothetical protein
MNNISTQKIKSKGLKGLNKRQWRNPNPYLTNISVSNAVSKRIQRHKMNEIRQHVKTRKEKNVTKRNMTKRKRKYGKMLNHSPPYRIPIKLTGPIGTKF